MRLKSKVVFTKCHVIMQTCGRVAIWPHTFSLLDGDSSLASRPSRLTLDEKTSVPGRLFRLIETWPAINNMETFVFSNAAVCPCASLFLPKRQSVRLPILSTSKITARIYARARAHTHVCVRCFRLRATCISQLQASDVSFYVETRYVLPHLRW
jgi:hypothetical protein